MEQGVEAEKEQKAEELLFSSAFTEAHSASVSALHRAEAVAARLAQLLDQLHRHRVRERATVRWSRGG